MIRRALIFYFVMALIGLGLAKLLDVAVISYLPTREGAPHWSLQIYFGVGVGFGVAFLGQFLAEKTQLGGQFDSMLSQMFSQINQYDVITLAIASGIAEEWLFRSVGVPLIGIWPSSILFALLHVPPRREFLYWPFFAFALGLGFAYWTQWSHSVLGPTLAHMIINAVGLRRIVDLSQVKD